MDKSTSTVNTANSDSIHQYYMDILNAVQDIVYWTDIDCNLVGCNKQFVKLLGLQELDAFKGTPYQQMKTYTHWPEERIKTFKLDDMQVIFSGIPRYEVEETPVVDTQGQTLYFKSTRFPRYDEHKKIIGLIVALTKLNPPSPIKTHFSLVRNLEPDELTLQKKSIPSILLIEDNLIAQQVEKALLMPLHCQVDIASSGDRALKLFTPGKYDLVLMDIGLADTSGYVVAKQLRKREENTPYHVPIIALSGYEAEVIKHDCGHYFMEGAITKPLTGEQAEQIIKHYVYRMDVVIPGLKSTLTNINPL